MAVEGVALFVAELGLDVETEDGVASKKEEETAAWLEEDVDDETIVLMGVASDEVEAAVMTVIVE